MISILIPSFDRPAQLECLLSSLQKFWKGEDYRVMVLYKYSNEEYLKGYDLVWKLHPKIYMRLEEFDFYKNWKYLLENCDDYVCLATDDCVLFKETPDLSEIDWSNDTHCFSLRLGENTIVQNYVDYSLQPKLEISYFDIPNQIVGWRFKRYPEGCNYGYAWSLDITLYRKKDLLKAIEGIKFDSPRSLEHNLTVKPGLRGSLPNCMFSPQKSCGFINTINCVQKNGAPPAGTKFPYSPEFLNEKFLAGEKISLKSFENLPNHIVSSHNEVPLIFAK